MKRFVLMAVVLFALGQSALAFAQGPPAWAGGWGTEIIDGPGYGGQTSGTPTGTGTCVPSQDGQGYGPGDGTAPMPRDGTGFGSPWATR